MMIVMLNHTVWFCNIEPLKRLFIEIKGRDDMTRFVSVLCFFLRWIDIYIYIYGYVWNVRTPSSHQLARHASITSTIHLFTFKTFRETNYYYILQIYSALKKTSDDVFFFKSLWDITHYYTSR